MFPHGAQKLFGFFTTTMHLPAILGVLAILAESIGPLLVFFGIFTRLGALAIAVNMIVAFATVHLPNG